MNLLLDAHTLIWYLEGDSQLSETCRTHIDDPLNVNFISIASFWEIAVKLSIGGKIDLSVSLDRLSQLAWENNISILPIQVAHTVTVRSLPFFHKDPFDRLIIAQAIVDGMTVLSRDRQFRAYPVTVVW
jgi:PIN domain nuclease of toxin-antitoxin system